MTWFNSNTQMKRDFYGDSDSKNLITLQYKVFDKSIKEKISKYKF